jgi:hypothetical protein
MGGAQPEPGSSARIIARLPLRLIRSENLDETIGFSLQSGCKRACATSFALYANGSKTASDWRSGMIALFFHDRIASLESQISSTGPIIAPGAGVTLRNDMVEKVAKQWLEVLHTDVKAAEDKFIKFIQGPRGGSLTIRLWSGRRRHSSGKLIIGFFNGRQPGEQVPLARPRPNPLLVF